MSTVLPLPAWEQDRSGLFLPGDLVRPKPKRLTCVDLFCGAGGFSLGVIEAGFEVVAACDNDPYAALTYMTNLGAYPINIHYAEPADEERLNKAAERCVIEQHNGVFTVATAGSGWIAAHNGTPGVGHFFFGDIRKFSGKQILDAAGLQRGELGLVVGGPPCQGFSQAGKRNIMDPRNSLVFEFARLIIEMQPRYMAMENVPGMLNMVTPEGVSVVDALCRILEDGGFAGYEALKRSLVGHPDRKVAARGKKHEPDPEPVDDETEAEVMQTALFS